MNELDLAFADLSYAIVLEPNDSDIYVNRAEIHEIRQNFDAALQDYEIALKLNDKVKFISIICFTYY